MTKTHVYAAHLTESPILFRSGALMRGRGAFRSQLVGSAAVLFMAFGLSGCIAAAIPLLLVAQGAALGLTTYKTVQLVSGGGNVKIGFVGKDGKDAPLRPLPAAKRVAIWPGNQGDVVFAQKLSETARFDVTTPASVSAILMNDKISSDYSLLTAQERLSVFGMVCAESRSELVFVTGSLGTKENTNFLSLSRANATSRGTLIAFSCTQRNIAWQEEFAIVVELGGNSPPTNGEIFGATAQALADRVIEAEDLGARQASAL